MAKKDCHIVDCKRVELDGVSYVILRASVFEALCCKAGLEAACVGSAQDALSPGLDLDRASLAEKLVRRRRTAGLSQAELARRAGIRPETLNRIERGRTDPDFATVRKLVIAMNDAEQAQAASRITSLSPEESNDGD